MSDTNAAYSVDMAVRVYPGTDAEAHGRVVDDFGDSAGQGVDVGARRIVEPARRWAVQLDSGDLVFVDSDQLAPDADH
ncbi:MAG: hypothetical protein V7643_1217 [Mycobacterium sp.]|jgi:hypothetical protein